MEYRLKVDSGAFGEVNKDYEKEVPSFEDTCKVGSCGRGWYVYLSSSQLG